MTPSPCPWPLVAWPTLLLLLVLGSQGRCLAESLLKDISKERAEELGITVRSRPSTVNDLLVQVEFETAGPLKAFTHADLELKQRGKRLVSAPLMPRRPTRDSKPGTILLEFYIDPAAVPNSSVTVFVYSAPLSGTGYRLQMKELLRRAASR